MLNRFGSFVEKIRDDTKMPWMKIKKRRKRRKRVCYRLFRNRATTTIKRMAPPPITAPRITAVFLWSGGPKTKITQNQSSTLIEMNDIHD